MNYEYRKTKMIKSEVSKIGPREAEKMLDKNIDNRKLRPAVVREYAGYMKNGLWRENGESILVTQEGYLLNGQHRLHAIIASGVTINVLIVTVRAVDGQGRLSPLGVIQDRGSMRSHTDINGVPDLCDKIAATMIRHLMKNTRMAKNTALRAAIYDVFSEEMETLRAKCGTKKRLFSRAAIHLALVLRLSQGYDHTGRYHTVLTDLVGLPTSWMSWYSRINEIVGNSQAARNELMVLTWILTEPGRDEDKKLFINGNRSTQALSEMQSQFHYYALDTIKKVIPDYEF